MFVYNGTKGWTQMRIKIRDTVWLIRLIEPKKFKKMHGTCVAVTISQAKEIHFKRKDFSLQVIIHELIHAYFSTLYLNSAGLSIVQFEEVIAEFLEDYIYKIYIQAKQVFKKLK